MLAPLGIVVFSLSLIGLGALACAPLRLAPGGGPARALYLLLAGWWALAILAVFCAIAGWPIAWLRAVLAFGGLGGLTLMLWRRDLPLLPLGLAWLALAPLVVLAAALPPTVYDEFVQWLPNTRYLVFNDAFPTAASPNVWSVAPSYPPALPLLGYLVGAFVPGGFEIVSKTFAVLLGAATGLLLARPFLDRASVWIAAPLGAAAMTVASPFFDPRIALTSYADMPTAFVLVACVFAFWRSLGDAGATWLWPAAMTASLLILLRETNIVLVAGLAAGLLLVGRKGWRPLLVLLLASGVTLALWRLYMLGAAIPPRLVPRTPDQWDWGAPAILFRVLLSDRLMNNPAAGFGTVAFGLLAVAAIVAGWRRASPSFRQLASIAMALLVTWGGFLVWSYIAFFSPEEIAGAGSAWRYGAQLGPLLLLVMAEAAAAAWRGAPARLPAGARPLQVAAAVAALGAPMLAVSATASHWRIDCRYPDIAALRQIAPAIRDRLGDARLAVLHPVEASVHAVALDYTLRRPFGLSLPTTTLPGDDGLGSLVLDLREIDRASLQRTGEVPAVTLLRRDGTAWAADLVVRVRRLDICRDRLP
jgi:hypothetical protein